MMRVSHILLALVVGVQQTVAFLVFAHFMVGNTLNYGLSDWLNEIDLAKAAGIDAFALNVARAEKANVEIAQAFEAATTRGFKLFFSFDYAGNGAWGKDEVKNLVNTYKGYGAYQTYNSKPLVSTFEGPGSANDWHEIKQATQCFFVPDWSSEGAKDAVALANGVADGLFSWAAWPSGPNDMNTHGDASYMQFLKQGGRPTYMMPVSPWFYTNLPGYDKNWLWRGDDLWFDRWLQVLYLTRIQTDFAPPAFAQIISWNDFGEAHYIGPIINKATYALDPARGNAPFNYANGVSHGGFRLFLPFLIQLAKTGNATIGTQGVQIWYRNSALSACGFAETVGNTATQMQLESSPTAMLADRIFYSALLAKSATVTVTVGGVSVGGGWTDVPGGGAGVYHGSVSFAGHTGEVVVTVAGIATVKGVVPIGGCTTGSQNFNPYTNNANGPPSSVVVDINKHVCLEGFGVGDFKSICSFSCALGYCPVTACTCTKIGPVPTMPTPIYKNGYPTKGDRNFEGLCGFAVNYNYKGSECSQTKPASYFTPALSPFFPDTSVAGVGLSSKYDSMCQFSCKYGWCPMLLCKVTATGPINDALPPYVGTTRQLRDDLPLTDKLLCKFTMNFGKASESVCFKPLEPTTTTKPVPTSGPLVYVDPSIYNVASGGTATLQCTPRCTYVLPPTTLGSPTTITFPLYTTTLEVGWFDTKTYTISGTKKVVTEYRKATETTVIRVPPITTPRIEIWNVIIEEGESSKTFYPKSSVSIPPITIIHTPSSNLATTTLPPRTRTITPPPWPWPKTESPKDEDDDEDDDSHQDNDENSIKKIVLVHKNGPNGPLCKSGCGSTCRFFCNHPCLLFCPDWQQNWDHLDPIDPVSPPPPVGEPTATVSVPSNVVRAPVETDPAESARPGPKSVAAEIAASAAIGAMSSLASLGLIVFPTSVPEPEPEPEPTLNFALTISITERYDGTNWHRDWDLYNYAAGVSFNLCNVPSIHSQSTTETAADPDFPGNIKDIKVGSTSGCEYLGTEDGPGTFNCPRFARPVQCSAYNIGLTACGGNTNVRPVVKCEYAVNAPLRRRHPRASNKAMGWML